MKSVFAKYLLFLLFFSYGCDRLDIEKSEFEELSNPDSVMALVGNSFRNLHNTVQGERSVALAMGVMADHLTCYWPNFGMRSFSLEPRTSSFVNDPSDPYYFLIKEQWGQSYKAISEANLALRLHYGGTQFGAGGKDNPMVEAYSWFVTGIAHGYLGLVFDKAVVAEWDSNPLKPQLESWTEVVKASISMLDKCIEVAENNSFLLPSEWTGGHILTNIELSQLAYGYATRIMASGPRTRAQTEEVDWDRVLSYAQNGMDWDFAPYLGDTYGWYDMYTVYGRLGGWCKVDMRVVNILDKDYPSRWPADNYTWTTPDGKYPGWPSPGDNRLRSDFAIIPTSGFSQSFNYLNSEVRCERYDDRFSISWQGVGPKPSFKAWEVKLLEAEALLRTGDPAGALAILNDPASPRKLRGGLPDVLATDDILRYILDEKDVECFLTGAGIPFFDMRRTDRLQRGTLLHFPVPARELEILMIPHYTITAEPDGINASNGGWTGWDE